MQQAAKERVHWLGHVLCLLPLSILIWDSYLQRLGAHPVNRLTHTTGLWALIFLLLSLSITPLRRIFSQAWIFGWRRSFGLYSFLYASLHLITFLRYGDEGQGIIYEMIARRYTLVGLLSFLILSVLAATSSKAAKRKLKKRWRQLHFLVYPAAILALLHFFWLVKADNPEPLKYALALALLLILRIPPVAKLLGRRSGKSE